jgi:hypothetical protein
MSLESDVFFAVTACHISLRIIAASGGYFGNRGDCPELKSRYIGRGPKFRARKLRGRFSAGPGNELAMLLIESRIRPEIFKPNLERTGVYEADNGEVGHLFQCAEEGKECGGSG